MKKKYLLSLAISVALPLLALAAFNDVQIASDVDTVISLNGVSLIVSSGKTAVVESIEVSDSSFSVVMPVNSYLRVTLASRRVLSVTNNGTVDVTATCSDSQSAYKLENPATGSSQTVTVDLTSNTCNVSGGGGGSSGGGGGGGGGYTPIPTVAAKPATPATPAVPATPSVSPAVPATPATPATPALSALTRVLAKGSVGADVLILQKILNMSADTRVAASGPGSPGSETTLLGPATLRAVQKFQEKYGIAKSGDSGYGTIGPKTRAKLNEIGQGAKETAMPAPTAPTPVPSSSGASVSAATTGGAVITRSFSSGATHAEVKVVQQILNSDADTRIAESGAGSPGKETNFFGPATRRAIQKFQEKYGIAKQGDSGYGTVGPKTRAKINEISASGAASSGTQSSVAAPSSSSGSGDASKQLEDSLKQLKELQEKLKQLQ